MPDFLSDLLSDIQWTRYKKSKTKVVAPKSYNWVAGRLVMLYDQHGNSLGLFREYHSRRPFGRKVVKCEEDGKPDSVEVIHVSTL